MVRAITTNKKRRLNLNSTSHQEVFLWRPCLLPSGAHTWPPGTFYHRRFPDRLILMENIPVLSFFVSQPKPDIDYIYILYISLILGPFPFQNSFPLYFRCRLCRASKQLFILVMVIFSIFVDRKKHICCTASVFKATVLENFLDVLPVDSPCWILLMDKYLEYR